MPVVWTKEKDKRQGGQGKQMEGPLIECAIVCCREQRVSGPVSPGWEDWNTDPEKEIQLSEGSAVCSREMTLEKIQSVKCLTCKHEDLGSRPEASVEKPGAVACTYNPSTEEEGKDGSPELPDQPTKSQ